MNRSTIEYRPIGTVRTEHLDASKTPVQPVYARGLAGRVEVFPEFADGLGDIEGFSHLYLLYHLDRAPEMRLRVKPFLQDIEHGIFATRAPSRPNPLGISLVRLLRREGPVLFFEGADILDATPLLDIKPYSPRFDFVENPRGGWTDEVGETEARRRGSREQPPSPTRP